MDSWIRASKLAVGGQVGRRRGSLRWRETGSCHWESEGLGRRARRARRWAMCRPSHWPAAGDGRWAMGGCGWVDTLLGGALVQALTKAGVGPWARQDKGSVPLGQRGSSGARIPDQGRRRPAEEQTAKDQGTRPGPGSYAHAGSLGTGSRRLQPEERAVGIGYCWDPRPWPRRTKASLQRPDQGANTVYCVDGGSRTASSVHAPPYSGNAPQLPQTQSRQRPEAPRLRATSRAPSCDA